MSDRLTDRLIDRLTYYLIGGGKKNLGDWERRKENGRVEMRKIDVVKPTLSTHEKGSLISFYFIAVCLSLAISINDETMRRVAMEIRGGVIE